MPRTSRTRVRGAVRPAVLAAGVAVLLLATAVAVVAPGERVAQYGDLARSSSGASLGSSATGGTDGSAVAGPAATSYSVEFIAGGLAGGASWSIDLGGTTETLSSVLATFNEPAGTYPLSVQPPAGYGVVALVGPNAPTESEVTVVDNTTFSITFGPVYNLTIAISPGSTGPTVGTLWGATLTPTSAAEGTPTQHRATWAGAGNLFARGAGVDDPARGEYFVPTPTGSCYYSCGSLGGSVTVVSASTGEPLVAIPVSGTPAALAFDPARQEVFVTLLGANAVAVISDVSNSVVAQIPVGVYPEGIAYDSGKGELVVSNWNNGTLSILSDVTDRVVETVTAGCSSGCSDLVYDPARGEVWGLEWVTPDGTLVTFNDTTWLIVASKAMSDQSSGVAYDPARHALVVGVGANVTYFNDSTGAAFATVPTGDPLESVAYDAPRAEVVAISWASENITFISDLNGTVFGSFALGILARGGMAVDPVLGTALVIAQTLAQVALVNLTLQQATLTVNSTVGYGYSLDFPVTNGSYSLVLDAVPGYAVDLPSLAVRVAGRPSSVNVTFQALTFGVDFFVAYPFPRFSGNWSVTLNGVTESTPYSSIDFEIPDGTYYYTVQGPRGIATTPAEGTVVVNGSTVSVELHFRSQPTPSPLVAAFTAAEGPLVLVGAVSGATAVVALGAWAWTRKQREDPLSRAPWPERGPGRP